METTLTPPGIRCPACGRCELSLGVDGDRPALTCPACKVLVRLLQRHGDEAPAVDFDDPRADAPPAGAWWLGYCRGADGIMRPLSLAESLSAAWDGLLRSPLRGALFVVPTDPPRRVEYHRVTAETDQ